MEEHISSYSAVMQKALKNKQALKKKQTVCAVVIVIIIVVATIIHLIIKAYTHKAWLAYMDKYYYPFLEINHMEENGSAENYYTLEKIYRYDNSNQLLMTQRPREDQFDFYIRLSSDYGPYENYYAWHVPFDDYEYRYDFTASVDRDGKWKYRIAINYYTKNSPNSKGIIGCYITDDGNIKEDKKEAPSLNDKDRKILNELLPQIRDLQNEMRYNILNGLT